MPTTPHNQGTPTHRLQVCVRDLCTSEPVMGCRVRVMTRQIKPPVVPEGEVVSVALVGMAVYVP